MKGKKAKNINHNRPYHWYHYFSFTFPCPTRNRAFPAYTKLILVVIIILTDIFTGFGLNMHTDFKLSILSVGGGNYCCLLDSSVVYISIELATRWSQSLIRNTHKLILDKGEIVVLFHFKRTRFSDLNTAPFVNCKPHGSLEHVNLCIPEDDSCTRLHEINWEQIIQENPYWVLQHRNWSQLIKKKEKKGANSIDRKESITTLNDSFAMPKPKELSI